MVVFPNNKGCPCIDSSGILASLPKNRRCILPNATTTIASHDDSNGLFQAEKNGVMLTLGGSCVPINYGSSKCLQHDLIHDPNCALDPAGERIIPAYCIRPWCYVDLASCKRNSPERVYRSSYFPFESEVDLFFSYTTCNSTEADWFDVEDDIVGDRALGGIDIVANIPTYLLPMMYKRDPSGGEIVSSPGDEYYDDSVPYEGVYIHYVKQIMEISKGDIKNITMTHKSIASSLVHPQSSFTAAVQDLEDGLVDMAIGPFWITGQRLKMTAFSIPIVYDKTFLVIPKPGTKDSLSDQIVKVLAPFSWGLWAFLLAIIVVTALLSVWFSDRSDEAMKRNGRRLGLARNWGKTRRRKIVYARLALDSFLEKGLFFCSAGVEQDERASLPIKLLLFGFGFFILISVSAYVANLAAFLTRSTTDVVRTMDSAIENKLTICAHPALEEELKIAWPKAIFKFHQEGREFAGVLDDYIAGDCAVLAIGYEDTSMDKGFLDRLCKQDLAFTTSLIAETPIAFPIRKDLASGFSYHMYIGERYHKVSVGASKAEFPQELTCNIHLTEDVEANDYAEIEVKNFFFPILFFLVFSAMAVILQIVHLRNVKKGNQSLVGRRSTLNLVADIPSEDKSELSWRKHGRMFSIDKSDDSDGKENGEDYNNIESEEGAITRPIMSALQEDEDKFEDNEEGKEIDDIDTELQHRIPNGNTESLMPDSSEVGNENQRPKQVRFESSSLMSGDF
eukprot:CAMPEP_0183703846 /NCGR_PEP_ID=MMETSP0737-20130205/1421_1 /TAXON_ID=385413 /ORGANISM="Thalassiosira miniscula, Strain CCMP1093" /LENGTH=733 /DNA_ID=CAMNT_0025930645 /DNA_START=80 /DNA_END=2281 /DNA_ORIENTATION=+